jgi:hypothetical protein
MFPKIKKWLLILPLYVCCFSLVYGKGLSDAEGAAILLFFFALLYSIPASVVFLIAFLKKKKGWSWLCAFGLFLYGLLAILMIQIDTKGFDLPWSESSLIIFGALTHLVYCLFPRKKGLSEPLPKDET